MVADESRRKEFGICRSSGVAEFGNDPTDLKIEEWVFG
jgi:hypothetical protein